jgi:pullulanase/glycogen debranching enzyme
MSQTRSAEGGILGDDMLRTDPQRSHQLGIVPAASAGQIAPLGATVTRGGVNFSLYSRDASGIELLLFDHEDDGRPSHVI